MIDEKEHDLIRSVAERERAAAGKRILKAVSNLRAYLDSIERNVARNAGDMAAGDARNMGQHVADIAEQAGKLAIMDSWSWTK